MRAALLLTILLGASATPARAQTQQVIGYAGHLGEWELVADVTETAASRARELHGPVTMTHIGLCSQDGPEVRAGEIRLRISGLFSSMTATMRLDGVECTYSARLSDAYKGLMTCPDRAPVPLTLWVK